MDNPTNGRKNDSHDAMGFLAGVFLGGLAGAVTMLLLAPKSGEETRAQIRQTGIELRDQTTEAVDTATEQVRLKARQISTGVRGKADELQEYAQGVLGAYSEHESPVVEAATPELVGSQV
jgi:gas vesicle protein